MTDKEIDFKSIQALKQANIIAFKKARERYLENAKKHNINTPVN